MLYQRLSPSLYSSIVAYTVAIGGMCVGYDIVVMNAVLLMPDFLRMADTNKQDTLTFLSSALLIGAAIGTIPAAFIADRFGRRLPISLGALIYIAGSGAQLAAKKRGVVLGGRAASGIGMGFMALCCTLYIAEMATSSNRGMLTSFQQFFQVKGVLVAAFVVYTATKDNYGKDKQWKMPLGVPLGPGIALMVLIWLMPESPRWLMKQGREAEAIHSLSKFHARGDVKDVYVCTQAADMKAACLAERDQGGPLRTVFGTKSGRRRFAIGSIVAASAQVTGHSIMQHYTPILYKNLNFTTSRTLLFQCAHAGLGLVGTMFAIALMDRLGRRFMAVSSMAICAIGLAGAMITIKQWPADSLKKDAETGHYAHIGFTWLFYFAFNAGIGPVTFTYTSEIFNQTSRSLGTAFCLFTNWFAQFMITQGAAKGYEKMEWKYLVVFLTLVIINGLLLFLSMPETKGRTLEEMDDYWAEGNMPGFLVLGQGKRMGKLARREREEELRNGLVRRLREGGGGAAGGDVELKGSPPT